MELIHRALRAGYQGIFITVDSIRFGYREADARNQFTTLPPPHRLVNYDDYVAVIPPGVSSSITQRSSSTSSSADEQRNLAKVYNSGQEKAWDQNSEQMFEQDVTWEDITYIKNEILGPQNIPLVIKGIMTAEDTELAIQAGADAIVVSNHGGRQLDGAMASFDALPEVVRAANGRIPIWLDSGIRRGTDILKALALGASAVGIGKPFFYALALGGEDCVSYLLELLHTELEAAMAICGIESISDITQDLVIERRTQSIPQTMPVDIPTADQHRRRNSYFSKL